MKISKLLKKLKEIKKEYGDINVCVDESHEYCGSVQTYLEDGNIRVSLCAQPEGPKSGKSEIAVVISY